MTSVAPSTALLNVQLTSEKNALEAELRASKKEVRELRRQNAELTDEVKRLEALVQDLLSKEAELLQHLKRLLRRPGDPALAEGQGVLFASEVAGDVDEDSEGGAAEPVAEADADAETDSKSAPEFDDGTAASGERDEQPKKRRSRDRRKQDESNLRREVRRSELPPEERRCPVTGVELVEIGVKVTTELHYTPAELTLIENHQVAYGPPPELEEERKIEPVLAPAPPVAVEGVRATAALLAWILCQKFVLHLPLYRQEDAFARLGVRLSRKTLSDWVLKCAFALSPVVNEIWKQVRAGPLLHLDDSRIRVKRTGPGGGNKKKVRQSYLWVFVNPRVSAAVFRFSVGRGTDDLAAILREGQPEAHSARRASGSGSPSEAIDVEPDRRVEVTIGDGYAANRSGAREANMETTHAMCWSHVLRKFADAQAEAPNAMGLFVEDIAKIYEVERRGRAEGLDEAALLELRRREAMPHVMNVMRMTSGWQERYSLTGKVAEAMKYTRNQRSALLVFLRDGRVPLDNNVCESKFCHVALGRRNWLFAGSPEGAEAVAAIYTLTETAKMSGVDPYAYLLALLESVGSWPASRVSELMPWTMAGSLPAYRPREADDVADAVLTR